jgi:S1-C subfamily serine protease
MTESTDPHQPVRLHQVEAEIEEMEAQLEGIEDLPSESLSAPPVPQPTSSNDQSLKALLVSSLLSLLVVLALLAAVRWTLPAILEGCRYAWTRGQLRAQYESAGEQLQQVSLESLGKVSQWIGQRVQPSVVHISLQAADGQGLIGQGGWNGWDTLRLDQGSGVIVDSSGYLLTNLHVIEDGEQIEVRLSDGRRRIAKVIGTDPVTDLAVLQIEADNLMPIQWGNSDQMQVGMPLWAAGSPFGLAGSITFGILSGKHRMDLSSTKLRGAVKSSAEYSDLMQSDVAVNPQGELVGINTAIIGESFRGVSFAIPSNVARRVFDKIVATGKMERGILGVLLEPIESQDEAATGIRVRGFLEGYPSPAKEAGIAIGDRIISINGQPVQDIASLRRLVGEAMIGDQLKVAIERDGKSMELKVSVAASPPVN